MSNPDLDITEPIDNDVLDPVLPDDAMAGVPDEDENVEQDQFMSDAEADGDALASAGWGTNEDYNGGCSDSE